jgi:predicted permease
VRGTLVVAQVAISLTLLAAASLLGSVFVRMMARDPGFHIERLVGAGVTLPAARLQNDGHVPFLDQLLERLRAVPGVAAASAGTPLPLAGDEMQMAFDIELHPTLPNARPSADMAIVVPGYFSTIGTLVLEGRDFDNDDDSRHPGVAIVNKAFADRFLPGQRVLGRRIESGATASDEVRQNGRRWREIVGVVGNARQSPLADHDSPIYYVPFRQMTWGQPHLLVRTANDAGTLEPELRRIVASLDGDAAVHDVVTLETMLARTVAGPRFLVLVMASFSGMALVLATVGLYGVLSYSVLRRTREIGVRMALGASRSGVVRMVLGRALRLVTAGLAVGLLGAIAATRAIGGLVPGSGAGTPSTVALAALVLIGAAGVAAVVPARRAASIDPSHALRAE